MTPVTIYTSPNCSYCFMAKRLLTKKGVNFEEIDVAADPARRPEMIARAQGRTSVPQIFLGAEHIGGCDDLMALDRQGGLDSKLAAA